MSAGFLFDHLEGLLVRQRVAVTALHRQGIEKVDQRDESSGDRYILSAQSARVAAAVEFLVVMQRDLSGQVEKRDPGAAEYSRAVFGVASHLFPFLGRQCSRLLEDRIRNADLPDVVHRRGMTQHPAIRFVEADQETQSLRQDADTGDVFTGVTVLEFCSPCQAEQCLVMRLFQPLDGGDQRADALVQVSPVQLELGAQSNVLPDEGLDVQRSADTDCCIVHRGHLGLTCFPDSARRSTRSISSSGLNGLAMKSSAPRREAALRSS